MDNSIVSKLKDIQAREGLTDAEMAERLGCSRQLYQGTRTEKIPIGRRVIGGIPKAFPELQDDVLVFLSIDANNSPHIAQSIPKKSSEAKGIRFKMFLRDLLWRLKRGK